MISPQRWVLVWLVLAVGLPAMAMADTLESWANSFQNPETQQKILDRIFPGHVGPVSQARTDPTGRRYFFSRGAMWVRLGDDIAFDTRTTGGHAPFLVVTCMQYQQPERSPMSGVTYLLHDTLQRALSLTAGYAAEEEVHLVELPKMGRSFLLILGTSPGGSRGKQQSATLYEIPRQGLSNRPKSVWTSPRNRGVFQLGFDALQGTKEMLLFKTSSGGNESEYAAYRWTGNRFEVDDFISESKLENLPESVWKF